jgi:hypothetical protein
MFTMRRFTFMVAAAVCTAVVIAPAAQAGTQVRQFEAFGITLSGPGANSPRVGDIALEFVFKNKRAGGKYTPRQLRRIRIRDLPLRCSDPENPAVTTEPLTVDLATAIKLTKKPRPNPKKNRYAFAFTWNWGGFATGYFNGTVDKVNGKGWPRAHGKFGIERYDFPPPGPTHCATSFQGWSAKTQCKRPGQSGDLPLCRFE